MTWEQQWNDAATIAKWLEPSDWVVEFCRTMDTGAGFRALDLGCGPGRHAVYLASLGCETHATDFTQAAVSLCTESLASRGLSGDVRRADMADLTYPDSYFDLIVAFNVVYHTTRAGVSRVIDGLWRILKPDGHLLVTLKSPEEWVYGRGVEIEPDTFLREGKGVPIHFCREDEIPGLFRDFEIVSNTYHSRVKDIEGKGPRRHARWMIVARKKARSA